MNKMSVDELSRAVREGAKPVVRAENDYDELMEFVGDKRFVLLGEASHGTHEFYRERARITERLIEEKNFAVVAVEADWPDAYRVNQFVRGVGADADAAGALGSFGRFPAWMWRNRDVVEFVERLRARNENLPLDSRAGFYGIDLYSLHTSIESVLDYLDRVDPEAAGRARSRYSCFEHHGEDPQAYGYAASFDLSQSCEDEAINQLVELQRRAAEYANRAGRVAAEDYFYAEQNARLVKNAEEYYRSMFRGRVSSWNLRDTHMAETIDALAAHLEAQGREAKIVVWAHNSHLGDARHTGMGDEGELNVGQLVRERHAGDAVLVGFSTYTGTVTAASNWGEAATRKRVRPALADSYEAVFHRTGVPNFMLLLGSENAAAEALREARLERAIGVIYRPETERMSHYFYARLPEQFDAVLHFDETQAVEPLERNSRWEAGEAPETYPSGL